jgi:hypothetical protein
MAEQKSSMQHSTATQVEAGFCGSRAAFDGANIWLHVYTIFLGLIRIGGLGFLWTYSCSN